MESLVHPKERVYFYILLVMSIIIYLTLIFSIIGLLYLAIGFVFLFIMQGLLIGYLRGNCIRVTETQFPEIYHFAGQLSQKMGLYPVPEVYILESGGVLNAFATRFMGRDFVVLYSDILEMAYEKGEPALSFILCHELAHLKRKHLTMLWLLYPGMIIPFLGSAYSRACEYTCDSWGSYLCPEGASQGLLVLAAGKKLYRNVNLQEYINQANYNNGFWVWFSEIISSHPNLPKRLKAVNAVSGSLPINISSNT